MKLRELKDLIKHFEDRKYDDYDLFFWDYMRQQKMDGHFGSLSHPEKELIIPIAVVDEKFFPRAFGTEGLPDVLPSPFEEGKNAYLKKDENFEMQGVLFDRYFYECEASGKKFTTTLSDTFTMCNFYQGMVHKLQTERMVHKLQRELNEVGKDIWEKINKRVTDQ